MKQQIWTAIATCLVTLAVTFAFNTFTSRLSLDKGRIVIGHPTLISGTLFSVVQVENWGSKAIDGLVLVVPASTAVSSIVTSMPIDIEEAKGFSGSQTLKRITFGGIPPRRLVRIVIPVSSSNALDEFFLPNVAKFDLEASWDDYSEDPLKVQSFAVFVESAFYAIFAGFVMFFGNKWLDGKLEKADKQLAEVKDAVKAQDEEYKDRTEKRKKEFERLQKEVADARGHYLRVRLHLLSRLSDYSKELEFWRNTVRKILLTEGLGKSPSEALIKSVTSSLQTYGTRGNKDDFDSIMIAARLLSRPDNAEQV
jgi:hypothetical protein